MNKNQAVLKLISKIVDGKCTVSEAEKALNIIERKYGRLDMLCEIENKSDNEYLMVLLEDAKCGIFSRESILKMASINETVSKKYLKNKCVLSLIIIVCVLVCLILLVKNI